MAFCFTLTVSILAIIGIILKIYTKLTTGWDNSFTCLVGKTAIVTGSNTGKYLLLNQIFLVYYILSGIGFETAKEFAKRGARVILACRNKEKAEAAQRQIIEATDNTNVVIKLVDFSSLDSVRAFAKDINENEKRLDILVNNAGTADAGKPVSKDGLELIMQTNYFSSFLLTVLLIGK